MMFAYIPARGGSKRIPRKNIRELGGKPVILHVIEALSGVSGLRGIGVSTDDLEIQNIVECHGFAKTLELRPPNLAGDLSTFRDLIAEDVPRFARHFDSRDFLFVLPTAALVRTEHYELALRNFSDCPEGLIMSVRQYDYPPHLALIEKQGTLLALFPDMFLLPTKAVPHAFYDAGCFYIAQLDVAMKAQKLIDLNPVRPFILPADCGIDIDAEADWDALEKAYAARQRICVTQQNQS